MMQFEIGGVGNANAEAVAGKDFMRRRRNGSWHRGGFVASRERNQ
jgi:hypothetical protein